MEPNKIVIELHVKRQAITADVIVEKVAGNIFKLVENEICIRGFKRGIEFEARIVEEGKYEFVRITKKSEYLTKQFILNTKFNPELWEPFGFEIMNCGGFWQLDFNSFLTINLPANSSINLDKVYEIFGNKPLELKC